MAPLLCFVAFRQLLIIILKFFSSRTSESTFPNTLYSYLCLFHFQKSISLRLSRLNSVCDFSDWTTDLSKSFWIVVEFFTGIIQVPLIISSQIQRLIVRANSGSFIKKRNGPRNWIGRTSLLTLQHSDVFQYNTTRSFLLISQSFIQLQISARHEALFYMTMPRIHR